MNEYKPKPFDLGRPANLLAKDLLGRIEHRNSCAFGGESRADAVKLIEQIRDARIDSACDRIRKLERIAVLADALLNIYYEFNGEGDASLALTTGEYADALQDAVAALGEEELAGLKYGEAKR